MTEIKIIIANITKRAGTERAVTNLANILIELKYDVKIISIGSKNGSSPYNLNPKVKIRHLGLPFEKHDIFFVCFHYYRIFNKLKDECRKRCIFIGTSPEINTLITLFKKKSLLIGCEHFNYEANSLVEKLLKRLFYRKLDLVVPLTERDRRNYFYLHNTVPIPNSLSFVSNKPSSCKEKKIISLGRLTKQKGYDLLIEVISLIQTDLKGWKVEIYGNGEEKENLLNKIKMKNLESLITINNPVENVEDIYMESSIYLSPSRWEGFPMVLLEAQASGLPCIAFDYPCGASEIISDGETGFVIKNFDIKMFSRKLLELVNDTDKRILFGKNAYALSSRYSSQNIGKIWKKEIDRISEGRECFFQ